MNAVLVLQQRLIIGKCPVIRDSYLSLIGITVCKALQRNVINFYMKVETFCVALTYVIDCFLSIGQQTPFLQLPTVSKFYYTLLRFCKYILSLFGFSYFCLAVRNTIQCLQSLAWQKTIQVLLSRRKGACFQCWCQKLI